MQSKQKVLLSIILTIILLAAAVLVWANQTGRINIYGAGGCACGLKCTSHCPGWSTIGDKTNYMCCPSSVLCSLTENDTVAGSFCVQIPPPPVVTYTVSTSGSPAQWTKSVLQNSENPTQEFNVATTVTPEPTTTGCDKITWEAKSIDPKLTLKANNATVFSDIAAGYSLVKGHTCMIPEYPKIFTAKYDITGLAKGDYTSKISLTGTYLTNTSSFEIPITITITDTPPTPDTQPPTAPIITAAATSCTQIKLTWTASTDNVGVTDYEIYNADNNQLLGTSKITSWTMNNASCNTTYKFYVKAMDAAGNRSEKSNTATVTTPNNPTLPKPNNVQAQVSDCHSIKLTWDAFIDNPDVKGFNIYNKNNNSLVAAVNGYNYTISGLNEKTNYEYYIKSHDGSGKESEASNSTSITTSSCTNKLVSTGQVLWFNILIALIISGIISWLILRKKE